MNKLNMAKRVAVVAALVEGNSIRATARMTNVSKPTILKLLAELGPACTEYQDRSLRGLKCRRIQCDEIWQFVYAKAKNVNAAKRAPSKAGDVWTWVAIDADSKLIPTWRIGALLHESSLARTMPTDRILTCRCDTTLVGRGRSSDSRSHSRGLPHSPARLGSGREGHLR